MRKFLNFLIIVLSITANARQISPDEAFSVAQDFFNNSGVSVPYAHQPKRVRSVESNETQEWQPYYVFNEGNDNGFVIISGDDRTVTILGYSNDRGFNMNHISPQLQSLLNHFATQINSLQDSQATAQTNGRSIADANSKSVTLNTAKWGQGYPYNAQCPIINGVQAPTGCTATAIAIIMKYHNWPEQGRSWDMLLDNSGNPYISNFSDYKFNYSIMPSEITSDIGKAEIGEVSSLMLAAGTALRSEYKDNETLAYSQIIRHEMHEKFYYSPNAKFLQGSDFSYNEWLEIIREQIDNNCPIICSSFFTSPGHTFVVDGYDSHDRFHINWGWDGDNNGFFYEFSPDNLRYYDMTIDLEPDYNKTVHSRLYVTKDNLYEFDPDLEIMNPSVKNIEPNVEFDLAFPSVRTPSCIGYEIRAGIIDENGKIKEFSDNPSSLIQLEEFKEEELKAWSNIPGCLGTTILHKQKFHCTINSTDKLQLFAKTQAWNMHGDEDWLPISGYMDIPTSCPVHDLEPQMSRIHYDINPYTTVKISDSGFDSECIPLTNSGELSILKGKHLFISGTKSNSTHSYGKMIFNGKSVCKESQVSSLIEGQETTIVFHAVGDDYTLISQLYDYAEPLSIHLDSQNTLESQVPEEKAVSIGDLTINGSMNAFDFWYLRENMPGIYRLNLSDAHIRETNFAGYEPLGYPTNNIQPENYIPEWALCYLQSLQTLILPTNLEGISSTALSWSNLATLTLPESISNFGLNVFSECPGLATLINLNPIPVTLYEDYFFTTALCGVEGKMYVPDGSVDAYKNADIWNTITQILPLSSYTGIEEVNAEDTVGEHAIYTLQGIRIKEKSTPTDIETLPSGLYIINGKKVMIYK